MRIGLNARYLGPNKNGVARYLASLLEQWSTRAREHLFFLYTPHDTLSEEDRRLLGRSPHFRLRVIPAPLGLPFAAWYSWTLPRAVVREKIDFFFSPDYFLPPMLGKLPRCMTIHDVSYLAHPEWFPLLYRLYCNLYSKRAARSADVILTVSEYSKKEILAHIPSDPESVIVTPEAVDSVFKPGPPSVELYAHYGIQGPFFLYVGKFLNRRHVWEALEAFRDYCVQENDRRVHFVLRGANETSPHQNIEGLADDINARLKRRAVVFLPYLTDDSLVQFYRGATAFFYLSTYEGFGLPVLEALACGTPVVTVRATSIPEVAGDAALYVDPKNHTELMATMQRLLREPSVIVNLRSRSLQQASRFSWAETANRTLEVIETTYARRSH